MVIPALLSRRRMMTVSGLGLLGLARGAPAHAQGWPPVAYLAQPVGRPTDPSIRPRYMTANLDQPADLWPVRPDPARPGYRGLPCSLDARFDALFARNGPGWAGGDTAYTIPLSDGQKFWVFNDAIVYAPGATPTRNDVRPVGALLRNVFALTHQLADGRSELYTVCRPGPDLSVPPYRPLVGSDVRDHAPTWTWLMHGAAQGDDVHVLAWEFDAYGNFLGTRVATFTQLYLLPRRVSNRLPGPLGWGCSVLTDPTLGYYFVYGVDVGTGRDAARRTYVCRTRDLSDPFAYEFFDGAHGWHPGRPDLAGPMAMGPKGQTLSPHVSNQYSVFPLGPNHYVYVSQDTFFSRDVWALASTSPAGAWRNPVKLFSTASWKPYPVRTGGRTRWIPVTYHAVSHVDLSVDRSFHRDHAGVLISYCRNAVQADGSLSSDGWPVLYDADAYRPYFVRVPWANFPKP